MDKNRNISTAGKNIERGTKQLFRELNFIPDPHKIN